MRLPLSALLDTEKYMYGINTLLRPVTSHRDTECQANEQVCTSDPHLSTNNKLKKKKKKQNQCKQQTSKISTVFFFFLKKITCLRCCNVRGCLRVAVAVADYAAGNRCQGSTSLFFIIVVNAISSSNNNTSLAEPRQRSFFKQW